MMALLSTFEDDVFKVIFLERHKFKFPAKTVLKAISKMPIIEGMFLSLLPRLLWNIKVEAISIL